MDNINTMSEHLESNFCEQNNFDNTCCILDENVLSNNYSDNMGEKIIINDDGGGGGSDTLERFFRRKPQTAGISPVSLKLDEKPHLIDDIILEHQQSHIGDNNIENLCEATIKMLSIQSGVAATSVTASSISNDIMTKTSSLNRIFHRRSSGPNDKNSNKLNKKRPQTANSEIDSSTQQKSRFRNYLSYYWNSLFHKGLPKTSSTELGSSDSIKNNDELHKVGECIFENNNTPLTDIPDEIIEINLSNNGGGVLPVSATL